MECLTRLWNVASIELDVALVCMRIRSLTRLFLQRTGFPHVATYTATKSEMTYQHGREDQWEVCLLEEKEKSARQTYCQRCLVDLHWFLLLCVTQTRLSALQAPQTYQEAPQAGDYGISELVVAMPASW